MGFMFEQCPRCHSTEGFIKSEKIGTQTHLDGTNGTPITRKKQVPVCRSCGKWSARKDINKIFSY
jgi:phage FluMu protein Com